MRHSASATYLYESNFASSDKTKSLSVDDPRENQRTQQAFPTSYHHVGHGMNQWKPLLDLRQSDLNRDGSKNYPESLTSSLFQPSLERPSDNGLLDKYDMNRHKHPLKTKQKSPQKPLRQKRLNVGSDVILPPPPVYHGSSVASVSDPEYESMTDNLHLIPKTGNDMSRSYANPVFLPQYNNHSSRGYADYNSFDEINGSLV